MADDSDIHPFGRFESFKSCGIPRANRKWKKRPIWAALERRNLAGASLIHATSPQEAHSVRARGITTPIAVIPNGVHLPDTAAIASQRHNERRTALFMSRLHPKKGLPMLLEAWARVLPLDWRLVIAGPDEGGHRAELEAMVRGLDLGSHVSFVGPLEGEQKQDALLNCNLFILPTHSENFGIAVAEAMAAGSPVITTHGAPWQILEQEDCGWWVEASVDGLTVALSDAVAASDQRRTEMGQRGQRVAADRFSWKSIAAEMESCYRWILGQGPRPASIWEEKGSPD
ncbi:glycosyltransferase [bacterium]|nr:glycosyltransferase [bacterium]